MRGGPIKASDHPIPGEVWRSSSNGLFSVSDQGRAKTSNGHLISPYLDRGRMVWSYRVAGRHYITVCSSMVAEVFLGANPSGPVRFSNGDPRDLRASNLITPWTAEQDDIIRASPNPSRAATEIGTTARAIQNRARTIGHAWETRRTTTPIAPLVDRLDAAKKAIEILERAGVSDVDINMALGIPKQLPPGKTNLGIQRCLPILFRTMSPEEIAAALGWRSVEAVRNRLRSLGLVEGPGWEGGTVAGAPDPLDGEEWRQLSSLGLWVSNLGRVASPRGLLKQTVSPGQSPRVSFSSNGERVSELAVRLMLAAFRPNLPYSRKIFINGDVRDVRLANIRGVFVPEVAMKEVARLLANFQPLDQREEAIQFALTALMDGSATTSEAAAKIGARQAHEIVGTYRHTSLDTERAGGGTLMQLLDADGGLDR